MDHSSLSDMPSIIRSLKNTRILLIGDIMLDRYVYGRVERISPESPVPVLRIEREKTVPGGAGNTLANLIGLETNPSFISVIGPDENGARIRKHLASLVNDTTGILTDNEGQTIVKTRFLAGHQQLLRTDFETGEPLPDTLTDSILKQASQMIKGVGALILSDYGKGLLRPDIIQNLIALAKEENIPVIVDPKGQDFTKYAGADVITPNKKELSEATKGHSVENDDEVCKAAHIIMETCDIKNVVATRSADGISLIRKNDNPVHYSSTDVEVFDVSGAGDAVAAVIGSALAAGAHLPDAVALANIAGGIVVTKVGTAPIQASELLEAVENSSEHIPHKKIFQALDIGLSSDEKQAREQVERWKARGLTVGLTNGCFDILHSGHVSYLSAAHRNCDRLIVALNRDESVKILKGPDRPVHSQNARAEVLGGLRSVDMVILFGAEKEDDDNTASALIKALSPDVYFKGGDYRIEEIPEAPTVQSCGGKVLIMPHIEGQSTTQTLSRLKQYG